MIGEPAERKLRPGLLSLLLTGLALAGEFVYPNPKDITQLWAGYDPHALPLEIEVKEERSDTTGTYQRLYFTGEVCEGQPVRVYAITGVPASGGKHPGILHIHGGGQTASMEWVRYWCSRGYAAVSLDWCGQVDSRTDFTRWGRVKANMFKDGQDRTTSPSVRFSPWYHWALVSRRAITLLESLPGVDGARLGIFGVSMGGHLTWLVAGADARVRAAAPIYGCGWNTYPDVHSGGGYHHPVPPEIELWRAVMEPETYARYIACPVLLLNASNDFHTHMDRCYNSIARVPAPGWVSITPRYDHHLEPPQGRTLETFMAWQLKGGAPWPDTPRLQCSVSGHVEARLVCDDQVSGVEMFSYEGSKRPQTRFWRSLEVSGGPREWVARVPVYRDGPLRVFANVANASGHTVSTVPVVLEAARVKEVKKEASTTLIDDFSAGVGDWTFGPAYTDPHQDWSYVMPAEGPDGHRALTLNPVAWGDRPIQYVVGTHKVGDVSCPSPEGARLAFRVQVEGPCRLSVHVLVDQWGPASREYIAETGIQSSIDWQSLTISADQCRTRDGGKLTSFTGIDRINFVGESPPGKPPRFAQVRWIGASQ